MTETNQAPSKFYLFLRPLYTGVITAVLFLVALVLGAPFFIPTHRGADRTEAVNNARQIGLALPEFEQSYGAYPNDSTAAEIKANTISNLTLGSKNSNDYFRQLITTEMCQNEAMFYAKIPNCSKPDNNIKNIHALEKGECGFSYLIGSTVDSPPETPVVVTPLIPGKALFDYKAAKKHFDKKAIILRKNGSVQTLPIDKSGRVWINGKDLFDPTQPFWNGKAPVIKWPDL